MVQSYNPNKRFKSHEMRDMVKILNKEPFKLNLTLVKLDDYTVREIHQLVKLILDSLDKNNDINFTVETEEEVVKFEDYLNMLEFPVQEKKLFASQIFTGDKNKTYSFIYFILQNFKKLEKRAYLGYYLMPIDIPDEFIIDKQLMNIQNEYEELVNVFKEEHREYDEMCQEYPDYDQIQNDIELLERERDQLRVKLKTFQHEKTETKEFQELLKATKGLRQEQEEEALLIDKMTEQEQMLSQYEQIIVVWEQRLLDAENSYGIETTGLDMLQGLRQEFQTQKEIQQRMKYQIKEKDTKTKELEQKLLMPLPDKEQIVKENLRLENLKNEIIQLEKESLKNQNSEKDQKLSIFKKQMQMVIQKKEDLEEEKRNLEEEKIQMEIEIENKKKQIKSEKGDNYLQKQDMEKFEEKLSEKIKEQSTQQKEIIVLENEIGILKKTQKKLKILLKKSIKEVNQFEEKYGIKGFLNMENEIEELAMQKGNVDIMKGKTLEEVSQIVVQLQQLIESKRNSLKDLVEKHKILKKEIMGLKDIHSQKEDEFNKAVSSKRNQYDSLKASFRQIANEYENTVSQIETNKEDIRLINQRFKFFESKSDLMNFYQIAEDEIREATQEIQKLKAERDLLKEENSENQHQESFHDLKFLLQKKLESLKDSNLHQEVQQFIQNDYRLTKDEE